MEIKGGEKLDPGDLIAWLRRSIKQDVFLKYFNVPKSANTDERLYWGT